MSFTHQRKFHGSANGDTWWLCQEGGEVFVLHERASGDMVSKNHLEEFLSEPRSSSQKDALLRIVGNLARLMD